MTREEAFEQINNIKTAEDFEHFMTQINEIEIDNIAKSVWFDTDGNPITDIKNSWCWQCAVLSTYKSIDPKFNTHIMCDSKEFRKFSSKLRSIIFPLP